MQPRAGELANSKRQQSPLVFQYAELPFDRAALTVELTETVGAARYQQVQPRALTHIDLGSHSPVGHRHLLAPRLASLPANVHSPCPQVGGLCLPSLTLLVLTSGIQQVQERPMGVR